METHKLRIVFVGVGACFPLNREATCDCLYHLRRGYWSSGKGYPIWLRCQGPLHVLSSWMLLCPRILCFCYRSGKMNRIESSDVCNEVHVQKRDDGYNELLQIGSTHHPLNGRECSWISVPLSKLFIDFFSGIVGRAQSQSLRVLLFEPPLCTHALTITPT